MKIQKNEAVYPWHKSHLIRTLSCFLSKHLGEVSFRSPHWCIRLLQIHRAPWKCFMRSGVRIHLRWDYEKTSMEFTTTDEIPQSKELASVVTVVHDNSYMISVMEVPFPMVDITQKIDEDTNINQVKVTFQRQESLNSCAV